MFGYIRPMQGELKVRELELFKACYCGLCHALAKKYGIVARYILNYELVLLAMLLWDSEEAPTISSKRCIASPCRKKRYCEGSAVLDSCAAYTVILTWWKLKDSVNDEGFVKSIPHRLLLRLLSGAYRKAAREYPVFDGRVREEIAKLNLYESSDDPSLDGAADKFAQILSAAVPELTPDSIRRPMHELLYHLGRWVYIIDAFDDYEMDIKNEQYNAIAARYPPLNGKIGESETALIKSTLIHSNNLLSLAFELLPENPWTHIVDNIIHLGMPFVSDSVLEGKWPPHKNMNKDWI